MKKKTSMWIIVCFILPLMIIPSMSDKGWALSNPINLVQNTKTDPSTPLMARIASMDQNGNGIEDSLDREIYSRIIEGTVHDPVDVTVMLRSTPTVSDIDDFIASGGKITAGPWTMAIQGFAGIIPYDKLCSFVQQHPEVQLVEKDLQGYTCLAYSAQQIGARPYVWNNVGLKGDSNSSIAILDTGIDSSHIGFAPGYGDQNFSDKIIGWYDTCNLSSFPIDEYGHGSHCAGIAAGGGFFSIDASGNAVGSGYMYREQVSDVAHLTSIMVNHPGMINVTMKWKNNRPDESADALYLRNKNKSLSNPTWTVATIETGSSDTWYVLTYNVSSTPSGGYDIYEIDASVTRTPRIWYIISWPYSPPNDGFSGWTGIAPQTKLVGVRADRGPGFSISNLVDGINWIIQHKNTYHITTTSMSFHVSENAAFDSSVLSLVNNGITVIAAAGNGGIVGGTNQIDCPGLLDEVITVAAMNQFDDITEYSSEGGLSLTGLTQKPDITAPGGSYYALPFFSVDSNSNDGSFADPELQPNDTLGACGTSMATPLVAGAASILVQAMGGYSNWQWTRNQALQPKMILLMTATETCPNFRECTVSANSPTLERGGKDIHEGYGRLNLDAAVDAVWKTYQIGSVANGSLGMPPTLNDISVLGQSLAWARNVQLISGCNYNFTLGVPQGADYDLYLYNNTGTTYGEPALVANSTTATTGGTETFNLAAPYTGKYYVVVKRANETTGSGNLTLTSTSWQTLTINSNEGGTTNPAAGVHSYTYGNNVTVTANPLGSYVFDHWVLDGNSNDNNPITVQMNANRVLTPWFAGEGGCPYAYCWNGTTFTKDNNILGASEIGNGTDTNDYYKLEQSLSPTSQNQVNSTYSLKIKESESEHDYIDQVQLKAVDHQDNVSIAVTGDGEIVTYQQPNSPLTCIDNNGTDRLSQISTMNGNVSDPTTYFEGYNDDYLMLNFGNVTASHANLIFRDDWKCMDVCINVQIPDNNGSWQTVDVLHPRSFWSMEAVNMTAYIPPNGNFTVRLLWTAPHRLDYVGLDTSTQATLVVNAATPILARHSVQGNVTVKLLYDDENTVELVNGQSLTMIFALPNVQCDLHRDFILFTNGYYYKITP